MEYQLLGMEGQAEHIYKSILNEDPSHPDALHLLGVIFYQKGEVNNAVPYIERAIAANATYERFHNTLGVCYRVLGRLEDAEAQFKLALALNPKYISSIFNLGLTFQQTNRWDEAILSYANVIRAVREDPSVLSNSLHLESRIRQCDLLQAQGRAEEALACWEEGVDAFPSNEIIRNELGNIHAQFGDFETAAMHYQIAIQFGNIIAEINHAHMLEIQGLEQDTREAFQTALVHAIERGLPTHHIKIRLATVLPKIVSNDTDSVGKLRQRMQRELMSIVETIGPAEIDNTPPLSFGYTTGYNLLFHGLESNALLKTLLYRVYVAMCPALLQGHFISGMNSSTMVTSIVSSSNNALVSAALRLGSAGEVGSGGLVTPIPIEIMKSKPLLIANPADFLAQSEIPLTPAEDPSSFQGQTLEAEANATTSCEATKGDEPPCVSTALVAPAHAAGRIKIGFVSRFFYAHPVGYLTQGIIKLLSQEQPELEVLVFVISGTSHNTSASYEAVETHDELQRSIISSSHRHFFLNSQDLGGSIGTVRAQRLDVLVYPEVGLDPVTYFMSFSRLARVQAVWLAHPDTTGVKNIDYFLGSAVELSTAPLSYSETLVKLPHLGTQFAAMHEDLVKIQESSPRTIILNRAKFTDEMNIPKAAHLYVVAHPLSTLHSKFDEAVRRLLINDRLGYLVILDVNTFRPTLQRLFYERLAGKYYSELRERVLFLTPANLTEVVSIMAVGHMMLDPFPVTGCYLPALQALSIGLPVITLPSDRLGGRMTLALYNMMGYGHGSSGNKDPYASDYSNDTKEALFEKAESSGGVVDPDSNALIVRSVSDYVYIALKLAHQPKLRSFHVANILNLRHKLFEHGGEAVKAWKQFIYSSLDEAAEREAAEGKRRRSG